MNTAFTKRSGFSMIELVFVIVILGVLAAVAVPRFVATRTDAQIATARSDMAAAQKAIVAKVFADNIDTTIARAPDPNKAVRDQPDVATTGLTWGEWIINIAGLDGSRWGIATNPGGDQLANEPNPNFGGAPIGWLKIDDPADAVAPRGNVKRNNIGGNAATKGMCGAVLGIAASQGGFMIFNPANAMMPYTNSQAQGLMKGGVGNDFCVGFSVSYFNSMGSGNKVVPLASSGTIEF